MKLGVINKNKAKKLLQHGCVWVLRTVLIIGMCYVFLFPLMYMVSLAIRDAASVNDPSVVWLPKAFSLDSLKRAYELLNYGTTALLSGTIAICSTLGALISCSLVGYGLARFRFKEKNLLFFVVILMIIVPPQIISIPSFLSFRYFDLGGILRLLSPLTGFDHINLTEAPLSMLTFILPAFLASGLRGGLFIFIFRQFFLDVPKELEEAARIDGCGAFRTYCRIIVPLAVPAFVTVMLFSVIWHWNDYYQSTMYFMGDVKPVSVMLSNLTNLLRASMDTTIQVPPDTLRTYLAAGALLVTLPPLLLYIFTQKYFTESIQRTGIVG